MYASSCRAEIERSAKMAASQWANIEFSGRVFCSLVCGDRQESINGRISMTDRATIQRQCTVSVRRNAMSLQRIDTSVRGGWTIVCGPDLVSCQRDFRLKSLGNRRLFPRSDSLQPTLSLPVRNSMMVSADSL
jgi:hypothetical protein